MQLQFVFITVSCLVFTSALPFDDVLRYESYHDDTDDLLTLLRKPAQLDRNKPLDFFRKWGLNPAIRLKTYTWEDCGNGTTIVSVKDFTLAPDPLVVPGTINIGFIVDISEDIVDGLSGDMVFDKKIDMMWVPLPCINSLGTCHFDDVCSLLTTLGQCPNALLKYNIPCMCPFKKNTYMLPLSGVLVNSDLTPGDYYFKIVIKQQEKIAICFKTAFTLA